MESVILKSVITNEQCPISDARVGEKATRVTAGLVLLTAVAILATSSEIPSLLLVGDFLSRAFLGGKASPYRAIAQFTLRSFRVKDNPVNAAPKVFAGRIGFAMSLAIATTQFASLRLATESITGILAVCAGLESFFGYCVGCKVHSVWTTLTLRQRPTATE